MLTVNDFVVVMILIALCITCYVAGYTVGKNDTQKRR